MLVSREEHAVAVTAPVHLIGEPSDGQEIVRIEEGERVLAGQTLMTRDLIRDRSERRIPRLVHAARWMASVTLCPPNPKEFESATST